MSPDEMWEAVMRGSDELAVELDLPRRPHKPQSLRAIDDWIASHAETEAELQNTQLDEEDVARLGLFIARVLIETHGGGLVLIEQKGHALDGEWAVTDFDKGIPRDYHVPFVVSATRIAQGQLTAQEWYAQLIAEARA